MLSIKECEQILNEEGNKYSKAQIEQIRESLYQFAAIEYDEFIFKQEQKK